MLWSERFVRYQKRQADNAIHRAVARLKADRAVVAKFYELLALSRLRAPRLLAAPVVDGRHFGVEALVNLARFHPAHIRPMSAWKGTQGSWRVAVGSLVQHLLCQYRVPAFLVSAWWAGEADSDVKRGWFIAHSRGASFRSLQLPIAMTRRMEHLFLRSDDHLSIEHAMRRAELLALGASPECVAVILSTRMGMDLRHGEFWRTVWMFLIANERELDPAQIAPMIDYLQAIRHQTGMEAQDPGLGFNASDPAFAMKGRTVASMLRLMRDWHRSLGRGGAALCWQRSPFQPMVVEEPKQEVEPQRQNSDLPRRWQLVELIDSAQLQREGAALHHCVASYAGRCYKGTSSIWSLRLWQGNKVRSMLTVEVDLKTRAVVQARGRANAGAAGKPLRLLQEWAGRERLRMTL